MTPVPLNYCSYGWDLDAQACPCDLQFNEWVRQGELKERVIYHFGTGGHHAVGIDQARNGFGNVVLGITASTDEYQSYIDLVTHNSEVSRRYLGYFGDIYLSNALLLPDLNIVTMFHLCEFSDSYTASEEYAGLSDAGLLDLFTSKVRPGGYVLFYTRSMAWREAFDVVQAWQKTAPVIEQDSYKDLLVFQKEC